MNCKTCDKKLVFVEDYDNMLGPENSESGKIYGCERCDKAFKLVRSPSPDLEKPQEINFTLSEYREIVVQRPAREVRRRREVLELKKEELARSIRTLPGELEQKIVVQDELLKQLQSECSHINAVQQDFTKSCGDCGWWTPTFP